MEPKSGGKTTIAFDISESISSLFYTVIDKERRKGNKAGQLLFLCSASIDLLQQSSESLVGRIAYIKLRGIDVLEYATRQSEKINEFWLRQHICVR